jgi:DNA-binding LytR/AlgR family response regulator
MNCIIIDDDELTRRLVESYINRTKTLKHLGSFSNAVEAKNALTEKNQIDLIFLDIMMPEMTGIEFLSDISLAKLQVIIISGYTGYALEAFEYDVTDYLVKPINYDRFFKAIDKAYQRSNRTSPEKFNGKFYIKNGKSFSEVFFDDILFIESSKKGVNIQTEFNKYTSNISIDDILHKMPGVLFTKVDDSFIINCEKVSHINENNVIVGHTDHEKSIPLTLQSKKDLMKKINRRTNTSL